MTLPFQTIKARMALLACCRRASAQPCSLGFNIVASRASKHALESVYEDNVRAAGAVAEASTARCAKCVSASLACSSTRCRSPAR